MAHHFYLDASGLAKRYVVEIGTPLVNHLFQKAARARLMCFSVGTLEVISILVRKKNALLLLPPAFQQAMLAFRSEVLDAADFSKIAVTAAFVSAAAPLVEKHSLNATDAFILPFGHLIRIREEKDRARAIAALLPVREARVTFPGNIMGVTGEHIEALKREKIPFEYVSKTANGQ